MIPLGAMAERVSVRDTQNAGCTLKRKNENKGLCLIILIKKENGSKQVFVLLLVVVHQ